MGKIYISTLNGVPYKNFRVVNIDDVSDGIQQDYQREWC